ncbi:MAG: periplasmic heavy metal sensor [Desulfobacteraceae bacterium]
MKRRLTAVLGIAVLVAALAVPAFAWGPGWGRGHHMMGYWNQEPGYCWDEGRGYGNPTQQQRNKLEQLDRKLYDETANLRNEIRVKSAQLDTVLNSPDPDMEEAKALQKEINDLRAELDEKRLNYEIESRKIIPGERFSRGHGRSYGRHMMGYGQHMGGYGPGSSWD